MKLKAWREAYVVKPAMFTDALMSATRLKKPGLSDDWESVVMDLKEKSPRHAEDYSDLGDVVVIEVRHSDVLALHFMLMYFNLSVSSR